MRTTLPLAVSLGVLALGAPARAQVADTDPSVPADPLPEDTGEIIVVEGTAPVDPAATTSVTRRDLQRANTVNVEDAVRYLPGVHVRKRYIGDPNGVLQIRGISTWQTARTSVVADGVPLSYHLQTRFSGAPRWALVSPEEVERVEVSYGPFAAAQSGHAMAGTVDINTRLPEAREIDAEMATFAQRYRHYGSDDALVGYKAYVSAGERAGDLAYFVAYQHLDNEGQPQSWSAVSGPFDDATAEPGVTGAYQDRDPRGLDRVVWGARGVERVQTHLAKLKVGWEGPRLRATSTVALLDRAGARADGVNYLRDASGATAWSCPCSLDGKLLTVRPGELAAAQRRQRDLLVALRVQGEPASGWRVTIDGSVDRLLRDEDRSHDRSAADPSYTGAGVITRFDDTGWATLDARVARDGLWRDQLALETGYQLGHYRMGLRQHLADDVADGAAGALRNASGGATQLHALFAQARWQRGRLDVTPGVRQELWRAIDGFHDDGTMTTTHGDRALWRTSPKLVAGYQAAAATRVQAGAALAYRFPIVEELFQNQASQIGSDLADASLGPERGVHAQLSLLQRLGGGDAALHLFQDDVRDTIYFQRDLDTSVSTFLAMDRVRTRGVEASFAGRGAFGAPRLDLTASLALQTATILENRANPDVEGNRFPRVPRVRATATGSYQLSERWDVSLAARYSSQQHDRLENDDTVPGFAAIDAFFVVDAHASVDLGGGATVSMGVDNLLDATYFVFHPYPQRTFFTDLRWSY